MSEETKLTVVPLDALLKLESVEKNTLPYYQLRARDQLIQAQREAIDAQWNELKGYQELLEILCAYGLLQKNHKEGGHIQFAIDEDMITLRVQYDSYLQKLDAANRLNKLLMERMKMLKGAHAFATLFFTPPEFECLLYDGKTNEEIWSRSAFVPQHITNLDPLSLFRIAIGAEVQQPPQRGPLKPAVISRNCDYLVLAADWSRIKKQFPISNIKKGPELDQIKMYHRLIKEYLEVIEDLCERNDHLNGQVVIRDNGMKEYGDNILNLRKRIECIALENAQYRLRLQFIQEHRDVKSVKEEDGIVTIELGDSDHDPES